MEIDSIVEAMLFASEKVLSEEKIAQIINKINQKNKNSLQISQNQINQSIKNLNKKYQLNNNSFKIIERQNGWKIFTKTSFAPYLQELLPEAKPARLSPAALESLAIIAYRQPVAKTEIESIRGVNCDGVITKLLEHQLIKISGRADLPGRPLLYSTTEQFLELFNISKIDDLPNASQLITIREKISHQNAEKNTKNQIHQQFLFALNQNKQ